MYVCMYACMHACMRVCMYVCMYGCMYVCMYIHIYVYICLYIYTYIHIYIYTYLFIYIYTLLFFFLWVFAYETIIHLHRKLQAFAPFCAGCFLGQTCSLEHLIRASLRRRPDLFHLEPISNDMKAVENQNALAFMGVSINGGTPKSMVYNGKSHWNGWWLWGYTYFRKPPYVNMGWWKSTSSLQHDVRGCGTGPTGVSHWLGASEILSAPRLKGDTLW